MMTQLSQGPPRGGHHAVDLCTAAARRLAFPTELASDIYPTGAVNLLWIDAHHPCLRGARHATHHLCHPARISL